MKKSTPPPAHIYDAALQQETDRHAHRLQELKAMQAQLNLLEEHMPAIRAAGLFVAGGKINRDHPNKALRIERVIFGIGDQARLIALLLSRGFKQAVLADFSSWSTVMLTKGHLRLTFSVDHPRAATAPAPVQPSAPAGTQFFGAQGANA